MNYTEALKSAVTTFRMPQNTATGNPVFVNAARLALMPYHSVHVVEPFVMHPAACENLVGYIAPELQRKLNLKSAGGVDHVVFYLEGSRVRYCGRIITEDHRVKDYDDHVSPGDRYDWPGHVFGGNASALIILQRLLGYLDNKATRYAEQPVLNRQQRRALGVSADHREYLIIRKGDAGFATATRGTEILKRLRLLHTVRGHMRHLSSGRTVPVRPHMRGAIGTATQAKDYVL